MEWRGAVNPSTAVGCRGAVGSPRNPDRHGSVGIGITARLRSPQSLIAIRQGLRVVDRIYRLIRWQRFTRLEDAL